MDINLRVHRQIWIEKMLTFDETLASPVRIALAFLLQGKLIQSQRHPFDDNKSVSRVVLSYKLISSKL